MSAITQADWALAAKVMGFDSTEALRRHGYLRALHKQWAERFAAHRATPSQRLDAKEGVTLYREVDALGGTGEGDWHAGYTEALTEVLNILTKRGFTEAADAKDGGQRVAFYWKDGSDIREGESLSDRDRRIYEQGRRDERVGEPEAFQ